MKLLKLVVQNFRAFGQGPNGEGIEIRFRDNDIVFLIGPNNSGKSSLLEAYDYFVTAEREAELQDFFGGTQQSIIIEGWVLAEDEDDEQHQAVRHWLDGDNIARYRKVWDAPGRARKQSWNPTRQEWQEGGAGGLDTILQNALPTPVWVRGLSTPEQAVQTIQNIVRATFMARVKTTREYTQAEMAIQALRSLVSHDEISQRLQHLVTQWMRPLFPDLEVLVTSEGEADLAKILEKQTVLKLTDQGGPQLDLDRHGHGIQRQLVLQVLRGLHDQGQAATARTRGSRTIELPDEREVRTRKTKMLLVEEPELFLHPQAVRAVRSLLYHLSSASEYQVMTTTHSPVVIDLSRPHVSLVRVWPGEGGTGSAAFQVSSDIFSDEQRQRMRMLLEFDPYVNEAFFTRNVVLVEGDTEVVVMRSLFERFLDADLVPAASVPHVVNCGSKMNIPLIMRVLGHFRIPHFVVHDLDATWRADGQQASAWSLNGQIWNLITELRAQGVQVDRFIMERDFESAHGYTESAEGKPYSAFLQASQWGLEDINKPAIRAARLAVGLDHATVQFDDRWVEERTSPRPERKATSS